jgi:1-aminocyclopropane-1-carboxylate deaminase
MTHHFWETNDPTPLQLLQDPVLEPHGVQLYLKRDDLIHPEISGNKFRKLKYNIQYAKELGYTKLLTFGGAFSNHIAATAAVGRLLGFETIGIIRGNELTPDSNRTLKLASKNGMKFIFVTRTNYQEKQELAKKYGTGCYVLPEGGTNELAVQGVTECMTEITNQLGYKPNFVTTAVGTGGTFAGLCVGAGLETKVLGFAVLKNGQYLVPEINQLIDSKGNMNLVNYEIFWDYHCGGYGKITPALVTFIEQFGTRNNVLLDPIYTGKMLFCLYELIRRGDTFKPNDSIVAVHTGGLQGRNG